MVKFISPLSLSLAPYIRSSRTLRSWFTPIAQWYAASAGYRQLGLQYDDLLNEERPDMQRALGRLTSREAYDRAYRMKRSIHVNANRQILPKDQWTKPEDDVRYLTPHVASVEAENLERKKWDTLKVTRKH